jgi:hypothetical protein
MGKDNDMKIKESLSHCVMLKDYKGLVLSWYTRYTKDDEIYWFGGYISKKQVLDEISLRERSNLYIKDSVDLENKFQKL